MRETSTNKKAQRMFLILSLLQSHPQGLTTQELARRCGVSQRTIQRDLLDLQDESIRSPLIEDHHRWRIAEDAGMLLPPVQFELAEAAALFLAARLLIRSADESMPCIHAGLLKLGSILPMPIAQHVQQTAHNVRVHQTNPTFDRVFTTIVRGWALQRSVRIWYRPAESLEERHTILNPYFIEPSGIGYAIYVIGYASHAQGIRTFKIERILRAELTEESFEIPSDFNAPYLLTSAWGIKYGEEIEEVVLRFSPAVAWRVRESIWHPSQRIEEEPDGGCRLFVYVAHPDEMRPWILGWGAECQVLSPSWLRFEISGEFQRASEGYATRLKETDDE